MEVVLTIAGSDSSAGAGIQQDLKTITAHGCYGATVITSLTSQNTLGVQASLAVPAGVVASQINAVLSDLEPAAIKIGMIPDKEVAEAIVDELKPYLQQHTVPVVYDPVMVSTSGYCLMHSDAIQYVTTHLFPLCTLITPNLPEAEQLGDTLAPYAYLLKGGHAEGDVMTDVLHLPDGTKIAFSSERITTRNLHGTGCTLSSAIASRLALGCDIPDAVSLAKTFVTAAIRRSVDINIGGGNGPILVD
jgi:hydroxymethylpyrimidine/phosphomethylpyrimidine kinase